MILSIVIPVYNAEKFIERCVNSLVNQNLPNDTYEIILVNDGSKDNSREELDRLAAVYTNVKPYHKANAGAGHSRNYGLDKATGKYTYFLDVDDYVTRNSLRPLLEVLEKNNLDILSFETQKTFSSNDNTPSTEFDEEEVKVTDGITYVANHSFAFEVWWYICNTEFLRSTQLRFETDKILEDSYFTAQLFPKAQRVAKSSLDVHRYVQEETSTLHNPNREHNRKIIRNLEVLVVQFNDLQKKYEEVNHPEIQNFLKELAKKKQFLAFYYVVRCYNSDCTFKETVRSLDKMSKLEAYPFTYFLNQEDKTAEKLIFIFNRKPLLYFLFNVVRPLKTLKGRIRQ